LLDRLHLIPYSKDGRVREGIEQTLFHILRGFSRISDARGSDCVLIEWHTRSELRAPDGEEKALAVDLAGFPAEGEQSAALFIVGAYRKGWRHVYAFNCLGQRFLGSGLGSKSNGFRLDVYGNPGDYLASGLDGAEIHVHCSGQDQLAQIMKSGKLVVCGDVGQTFMYGAKGGEAYVLGNAAGRPLINAVGKPRVVINGTCLDYLAESFMAGDPLNGGGFVILNGLSFGHDGKPASLPTPYPGGNLFSLASGGAIYLRDTGRVVSQEQLNGGRFSELAPADWKVIQPYLEENERLFGISLDSDLLNGTESQGTTSYRKIEAIPLKALADLH
jgi:glutamate synthase domain-containing protein 3